MMAKFLETISQFIFALKVLCYSIINRKSYDNGPLIHKMEIFLLFKCLGGKNVELSLKSVYNLYEW